MRKSLKMAAVLLCVLPNVAAARGSMEANAFRLSRAYLGVWSSNSSAALQQVSLIYGPRVRFYGRVLNRSGLQAEKRRFIQRWPIRRYALRPGTVRVSCSPLKARCTLHGVIDWRTESPRRAVRARLVLVRTGIRFFDRTAADRLGVWLGSQEGSPHHARVSAGKI